MKWSEMDFRKELDFARSVAMHAGELATGHQTRGIQAEAKSDLSPVTVADRECERLIASRIEETFPEDGILGEEGTHKPSRNGRLWIVDPIDGTRDFVRGLPLWSTLIGLEVDGIATVGVCHMQARREQYSAVKGQGAWLNEQPISISRIDKPSSALVCINGMNSLVGFPFSSELLVWLRQFWAVRSLGGCVDAMMLASGRAEIWLEPHAAAWDLIALKVILEEAGAHFWNLDGGSSIRGGNAVAFVPALELSVRKLLSL